MNYVNWHERRSQGNTFYSFSMSKTKEMIKLIKLTTTLEGRKTDPEMKRQSTKNNILNSKVLLKLFH